VCKDGGEVLLEGFTAGHCLLALQPQQKDVCGRSWEGRKEGFEAGPLKKRKVAVKGKGKGKEKEKSESELGFGVNARVALLA
jgi:hypothetical protein